MATHVPDAGHKTCRVRTQPEPAQLLFCATPMGAAGSLNVDGDIMVFEGAGET